MCYEVLIYAVNDVTNFKIYLQTSSKAMADRDKKKEKKEIQKFKYLKNEKSFLNKVKRFFHSF